MAPYSLFCFGNPLLDIQVANGEKLLEKYLLKANDAILAEEQHSAIYDDIVKNYNYTLVAGGAAQNAARGAAYILPPKSVVYTGCVGDDELADMLKAANEREGLDEVYQVKKGKKTGACAVVITGHHRSLVTTLRAAEEFDESHLSSAKVAPLVENASVFYVEGYFLTHGVSSVLDVGIKSSTAGKTFVLNLSAPFIPQFYGSQLQQVLPYCDIIIGNEAEAEAYALANGLSDPKDLPAIASAIALSTKANPSNPRIVIFTQGAESTVMVSASESDKPETFTVNKLLDDQIVDTNGAGDAFAGGFLGAYVSGKTLDKCVEVGHELATMCIQQVGSQYKWPKVTVM